MNEARMKSVLDAHKLTLAALGREIDIKFLSAEDIIRVHAEATALLGEVPAIRDRGAIASAAARPVMRATYAENGADVIDLAACLGHALLRNHGFVDGNKRAAFGAMAIMLDMHGIDLTVDAPSALRALVAAAADDIGEVELAGWIRENLGGTGSRVDVCEQSSDEASFEVGECEAFRIVLELAEQGVLEEDQAESDAGLEAQRERQLAAVAKVRGVMELFLNLPG